MLGKRIRFANELGIKNEDDYYSKFKRISFNLFKKTCKIIQKKAWQSQLFFVYLLCK